MFADDKVKGLVSAYAKSMAASTVTRCPSRAASATASGPAPRSTTLTFPGSASQERTASSCRAGEPSGGGRGAEKIVTLGVVAPLPTGTIPRLPPSSWWPRERAREDREERQSTAAAATRRHPARHEARSATLPRSGRRRPRRGGARRWCQGSSGIWARAAAGGQRKHWSSFVLLVGGAYPSLR